jgi:hypothetical protein
VLSADFAGFTLSALVCNRVIERIGHIRAYAAFAGRTLSQVARNAVFLDGPNLPLLQHFLLAKLSFEARLGVHSTAESN